MDSHAIKLKRYASLLKYLLFLLYGMWWNHSNGKRLKHTALTRNERLCKFCLCLCFFSRIFLTWSNNFLFSLKVVQGSTNHGSVFKKQLNPRPNTRYLRLSPQYWYRWPCLRVGFLGCSKDEGKNFHYIFIIVIFPSKRGRHCFFAWHKLLTMLRLMCFDGWY